jgi:hypothetical protein
MSGFPANRKYSASGVSEAHIRMGAIVQTHSGSFLCEIITIKEANNGNRNRGGNTDKARF